MNKIKVLNMICDMNNGGAQKVVLNYLNDLSNDKDIEFKVLVINKGDENSYCNRIIKENKYNVEYLDYKKVKIPYFRRYINKYLIKKALNKYLKNNKPDIVHVHISELLDIVLKPIINNNIPVKFDTLHSNPYRINNKKIKSIKKAFNTYNFIPICLNNEQAELAKKRYGISHFEIIRNGIDYNKIRNNIITKEKARELLGLPKNSYIILGVGRLNKVKRFDLLIDIYKQIHQNKPNALLVFAGDGEEKNNLINKATELGLKDNIVFLGHVDNITQAYCAGDILAMTSITEASPLTLVEAQICGLRCVISDGTPDESIITNKVQKVSKNATIEEWAKAINNNKYIGKKICEENDYEIHQQSQKMKELYIDYYNKYINNKIEE